MTRPEAHPDSVVRVDVASAVLLAIGLFFGVVSIWLIASHGVSPLIFIPSFLAAFIGVTHLFKHEAPRDLPNSTTEGNS